MPVDAQERVFQIMILFAIFSCMKHVFWSTLVDIEHLLVSIAQKVEKRTVEIRIKYWLNIIGGGGGIFRRVQTVD